MTRTPPRSPEGDAPAARLVGEYLDGFRVLEFLGRRETGLLYRAVHTEMHRTVAIKLLPAGAGDTPTRRGRFLREIRALEELRHPGIVELLDGSLDTDPPYYAMEFVEGEALTDLLGERAGPWPYPEVRRLAEELLDALRALHERGLVHRDLVPASIMHDVRGRFRVVDFGVVWAAGWDPVTAQGETPGTPARLAPEVQEGRAADAQSDLYQLGLLLLEACTGQAPSPLEEPRAAALSRSAGMPRGFPDWMERLLAPDPEDRFPDAAQARRVLDAVLEEPDRRLPAAPAGEPAAAGRSSRGRLLAAGALALFAAAGWWWTRPAGPSRVFGVREHSSATRFRLSWKTGLPEPSRLRLQDTSDGRVLLLRSHRSSRLHELTLPLLPDRLHRYEILDARGRVAHAGEVTLPSAPLLPESVTGARPDHRTVELEVRTRHPTRAALRYRRGGARATTRSDEPATLHRLRVGGLTPDEGLAEAALVLEDAGGGRRELAVDPSLVESCRERLEAFLDRGRSRYLPVIARAFERGDFRVGDADELREKLDRLGFARDLEAHVPLFRSLLGDPSVPETTRRRLYRKLTQLEDIDSVFFFMESERTYAIHRAYDPYVPIEFPDALPPGSPRLRQVHGRATPLLAEAVLSGFARFLAHFGAETTAPALDVPFVLKRQELGDLEDPRLVFSAVHLNAAAILELTLNDRWVLSLRRRSPMPWVVQDIQRDPLRFHEPDDRLLHLSAPLPAKLLRPGKNLLEVRVRPLRGIPAGETSHLLRIHLLLR